MKIAIESFKGGRFYRHRQVYSIRVDVPGVAYIWWNDGLSPNDWGQIRDHISAPSYLGSLSDSVDLTMFLFGISPTQMINRMLSRCEILSDRRGVYTIKDDDWRWVKRPRRERTTDQETLALIKSFGPDSDFGQPRTLMYRCCSCGREGIRSDWPWRSMPGFDNSDYVSECPKCKAKGGDMLEALSGKTNLKIERFWSGQGLLLFMNDKAHMAGPGGREGKGENNGNQIA